MKTLQDNGDTEGRVQRYRQVPKKLREALIALRDLSPTASIHLGDIVNGNSTQEKNDSDFETVASIFEQHSGSFPQHYVLGNHCLAAGRPTLISRLGIPTSGYYSVPLATGWRLIVLDTTEMSGHSEYPPGSSQYTEAREYEAAHPLNDENPQMSPWNGGITKSQFDWLKLQLSEAEQNGERVFVAAHHQVGLGAARATHMAWNWKEIQDVLLESPSFALLLAGHDHLGGYAELGNKKHFVTIEALLEVPEDSNAYAIAKVYRDRIEIEGFGTVTSRQLAL